jgi:hypothetical protein
VTRGQGERQRHTIKILDTLGVVIVLFHKALWFIFEDLGLHTKNFVLGITMYPYNYYDLIPKISV